MSELRLNHEERMAIKTLKALARTWPKSLWLYSASGSLCVMKKVGGKKMMVKQNSPGPGFDPNYMVEQISGIDNDGGDW